jgi:hypothetical protein
MLDSGSHDDDHEDFWLLDCDAMECGSVTNILGQLVNSHLDDTSPLMMEASHDRRQFSYKYVFKNALIYHSRL